LSIEFVPQLIITVNCQLQHRHKRSEILIENFIADFSTQRLPSFFSHKKICGKPRWWNQVFRL